MSFNDTFFEMLSTPKCSYKGVPVNVFGLPTFSTFKSSTISGSVSRLKKGGFIIKDNDTIFLTEKGKIYAKKRCRVLKNFTCAYHKNAPKNLIIMYDISEPKKKEREWFRFNLKQFGYIMIQKSVWVGPSPLPKEFLSYAHSIGLKDALKTFKLAKPYNMKEGTN